MLRQKMSRLKKINIREFNRNLYHHLDDFPLLVVNSRTGEPVMLVLEPIPELINYLEEENEVRSEELN